MMKSQSTMEMLFGEKTTSLEAWKLRLDDGVHPSLIQIADIIEANSDEVLPAWFVEHLCKRLRNPDKPKRGRPRAIRPDKAIELFAALMYPLLVKDFQNERRSMSARGQKRLKTDQPPSERAARMIQRAYYKHMNWEAVRNLISSQK